MKKGFEANSGNSANQAQMNSACNIKAAETVEADALVVRGENTSLLRRAGRVVPSRATTFAVREPNTFSRHRNEERVSCFLFRCLSELAGRRM